MNILIVGASRGIGLEFVRQYRAEGHRVVATARSAEGLERIAALGAKAVPLDVIDAAGGSSLAWPIDGEAFDVAVINAGVYGPRKSVLQVPTQDEFDLVMRTNVLGPMRVAAQLDGALAPGARLAMITSKMGSIGGRTNGGGWLYRASKAAANSVLRDLSFHYAGRAICAAYHPGWVRTDMGGAGADLDVADSVRDLRAAIAALTEAGHGGFYDHDGTPLPW